MKLPEYVTKAEVRRVCKELGLSDWTRKNKASVTMGEAKKVLRHMKKNGMKVDPGQFRAGLEVELEHGMMFKDYNITNNHPILTGKVVMAHFMEMLDYYYRLEKAELEGDLLRAVKKGNAKKALNYMKRLAAASGELAGAEAKALK
jgi:hydrogenase maturation factor